MIDLLSPVGDFECLKAAVQNGANSVYLGASSFSARARATNFNNTELIEAIKYADSVIINAPFTQEVRDLDYFDKLKCQLKKHGTELFVVWISATPELCYFRMKKRNSDRDKWKLENWEKYIKTVDFTTPNPAIGDELFVFKNSTDEEANEHFSRLIEKLKS